MNLIQWPADVQPRAGSSTRKSNEVLDPLIVPLGLDEREIDDLLAFLQSLTGSNVDALVVDAHAAPIGGS